MRRRYPKMPLVDPRAKGCISQTYYRIGGMNIFAYDLNLSTGSKTKERVRGTLVALCTSVEQAKKKKGDNPNRTILGSLIYCGYGVYAVNNSTLRGKRYIEDKKQDQYWIVVESKN